jgi:hypothetical protein
MMTYEGGGDDEDDDDEGDGGDDGDDHEVMNVTVAKLKYQSVNVTRQKPLVPGRKIVIETENLQ